MMTELKSYIRPEDSGAVELWMFPTREAAALAGFRGQPLRREDINARAWTLEHDPNSIRGLRLRRVVVSDQCRRYLIVTGRSRSNFELALETARWMLRYGEMAWIEL